jgi:OOP family OmpA-OmpF porin
MSIDLNNAYNCARQPSGVNRRSNAAIRMEFIMKTKHILLATAIAAVTSSAIADDHKADIFVHGGIIGFSDVPFEDGNTWGLSAGYALTEDWTLEAVASRFDTETTHNDPIDVDGTQYRLDALYHLPTNNEWRPFLAFGVGDQTLDFNAATPTSHSDTLVNIGLGLKRAIGENFEFRSDLRNFNSIDNEYNELALTFGLGYRFGVTSSPKPVVAAPAPAPLPEPVKEVDSDGDGVFDSKDQCANTPKTHKVDAVGCSLKLTETVEIELNITFDSAKSVIKPEFENEVSKLAEFMNQYADTVVTVEGHTDSQGADAYNQKLSQSRADAVKAMLITKYGVAAERVKSIGYGEAQPIADNATADGREQNRRVVGEVSSTVTKTETK